MPWVQIQWSSEAKWADYERVREAVGDDRPGGLMFHAAGEIEDGRWKSVSVWESEEHYHRFENDRLMPAVERALGPEMVAGGPPRSDTFETKHVWGG